MPTSSKLPDDAVDRLLAIQEPAAGVLAEPTDDAGHAKVMLSLYGNRISYSTALGWLADVGTHWQDDAEHLAKRAAVRTLRHRRDQALTAGSTEIAQACVADSARVNGVLALYRALVTVPGVNTFDADPDMLPVGNGVLHLPTLELYPHDPSWRVTACLDVDFDPDADMTEWQRFITETLTPEGQEPDLELLGFFQMAVGYSLTGHTREEIMLYLCGKPRAGKGTIAEAFQKMLGKLLCGWADFATFTRKRDQGDQGFDLEVLRAARLVIASESTRRQSLNPAKIKQLTGGDEIACARKYRTPYTYRPLYKVWLISNHEVRADPDDDALWGRIRVVTFPNSHLGREDVTLKARFKQPEQQQAILRWAAEGARRWYERGRLPYPESVKLATKRQRDAQDSVLKWIEDRCELGADRFTGNQALMESYRRFCELSGFTPLTATELADTLIGRFDCARERRGKTSQRGLSGIAILAPGPQQNGYQQESRDAVQKLLDREGTHVES